MINLDSFNVEELEEFVSKAELSPTETAKEHFPTDKGAVRAINHLIKYAKERSELLKHAAFGREDKVKKLQDKCNNIYRSLPDYAKWLE